MRAVGSFLFAVSLIVLFGSPEGSSYRLDAAITAVCGLFVIALAPMKE